MKSRCIPNLVLPDTGDYQIGKYGRMRRTYLKEHRKVLYTDLMQGMLFKHLAEIDQSCNERMEVIVSAMVKQENVTEELKAANQMEWTRRINGIFLHFKRCDTVFLFKDSFSAIVVEVYAGSSETSVRI